MPAQGQYRGPLDGSAARGILAYRTPRPKVGEAPIRQLVCSVDVQSCYNGTSNLPRLDIRWGHGAAQQRLVADLGSCRFSVVGSSLAVNVFEEADDPAAWVRGATVDVSAIVSEGYCEPQLLFTSPSHPFNEGPGWYAPVPRWARNVWVVAGNGNLALTPCAAAAPVSSFIHFTRTTSAPMQSFATSDLIHSPKALSHYGSLDGWFQRCSDALDTNRFRLQFGLGI